MDEKRRGTGAVTRCQSPGRLHCEQGSVDVRDERERLKMKLLLGRPSARNEYGGGGGLFQYDMVLVDL